MTNVFSLDTHRAAARGARDRASPIAPAGPAPVGSAEISYIRAAGAMAQACADWCVILLHRPCPQGMVLLAEARLLVSDLLAMGGAAPQHLGDLRNSTPEELTARIRHLKERAGTLGVLPQPPQ